MRFNNFLNDVLGSVNKIRLLRFFFKYPEKEFTGSELQRVAGIPQPSVLFAIRDLVDYGIISFKRIGNSNVYKLNKNNYLSRMLSEIFEKEGNSLGILVDALRKNLMGHRKWILRAILFGSVANGAETVDSDIDLFILLKNGRESLKNELDFGYISRYFGNEVSVYALTEDEFNKMKKEKKPILEEIERGISVM